MRNNILLVLGLIVGVVFCFADDDNNKKNRNRGFSKTSIDLLHSSSSNSNISESSVGAGNKENSKQRRSIIQTDVDKTDGKKYSGHTSSAYQSAIFSYAVERYAHYTIRNGWFEGIGPVTAEQSRHMTTFYEFSRKNADGHWTRVRAMDSYGRMNGTYQFQRAFTNLDWDKATWQWDDVPKETVEIRISNGKKDGDLEYGYYDKNGELLCTGHSRKVSDNACIMHFTDDDNDTIPLHRHKVSADVEALYYKRDSNGFDAYVKFYSKNGGLALNTDSAFAVKRTYDKKGNRLTDRSLGIINQPIYDYSGNNGWAATYDSRGNEITSTNMDIFWHPMNMPETTDPSNRYVRHHDVYDKYDRIIRRYYTDADDNPMTDGNGLASMTFKYNDHGLEVERRLFDINGKPFDSNGYHIRRIEYDKHGYATSERYYKSDNTLSPLMYHYNHKYDGQGNEIFYECRDENGKLQNDSKELARMTATYNTDGTIFQQDKWKLDSLGNLVLFYYRHENADSLVFFKGDHREIYLKDSRGKQCEDYQINLAGDTIPTGYSRIYYRDVYTRHEEPHKTTIFRARYDKNNRIIFNKEYGWSESYLFVDSVAHTKQWTEYDSNHNMIFNQLVNYIDFDDPTFITRTNLNDLNVPCWRCTGSHIGYKALTSRDQENNDNNMFAYYNEWGEPAYTILDYEKAYHMIYVDDQGNKVYDEHGNVIKKSRDFFKELPKAISIEVTDSVAYNYGIRDNDIILAFGDWMHKNDWTNMYDRFFYLETILKANESKNMLVLRSDANTKTTWVEEVQLKAGRLSDLGITPVLRCLNEKENERLKTAFDSYCSSHEIPAEKSYHGHGNNWAMLYLPMKKGYTPLYTDLKIRSPYLALIQDFFPNDSLRTTLGSTPEPKDQWVVDEEKWCDRFADLKNNDYEKINIYYTDDFSTINVTDSMLSLQNYYDASVRYYVPVSDSIYSRILKLRKKLHDANLQVRELANRKIKRDTTLVRRFTPMEIIAEWAKDPEHIMMDNEFAMKMIEDHLDTLGIDKKKSKFHGFSVNEDLEPQEVVAYNALISKVNTDQLVPVAALSDSDFGNIFVYALGDPKKNPKTTRQYMLYIRDKFIVVEGKFTLPKNDDEE